MGGHRVFHKFFESSFVFFRDPDNLFQCLPDQHHHMLPVDPMLRRAPTSNRQLGIIRTSKLRDPFAVIDPVDIHHRTAVCAV